MYIDSRLASGSVASRFTTIFFFRAMNRALAWRVLALVAGTRPPGWQGVLEFLDAVSFVSRGGGRFRSLARA